ncbi:MAG: hypothetical protein LBV60_10580 [Streptomyces sp.]|jgi:hypothetical protein|nr:hypothetical protein [Streptomyces sp.]
MNRLPDDLVKIAVEQALAIEGPADRARAITGILDVIKERGPELKAVRRSDVLVLRKTLTLREVGGLLDLSIPRVDQIAKGK